MWLCVYFKKRKSLEKAIDTSWRLLHYNKWERITVIKNNNNKKKKTLCRSCRRSQGRRPMEHEAEAQLGGTARRPGLQGRRSAFLGSIARSVTSHILTSRLQLWKPVRPRTNQWMGEQRRQGTPSQAPWLFLLWQILLSHTSLFSHLAQMVKRLPTMQETRVQSLSQEDPLEKEMAPHSSILAWKIPWMEEPGRLQSMGLQRVGHDWATSLYFTLLYLTR